MKKAVEDYDDVLRQCHEFKQSLNVYMGWSGGVTHRQFMVVRKWLHDDWEKPSRTDKYIMRLTYIVDNMFTKPADLPPEDNYRLKYTRNVPPPRNPIATAHSTQRIPIDPTGQTVVGLPPDLSSQEEHTAKEFMQGADPSTIVDAQSDDESWKRQRRVWLKYAGIATDAQGNVIRKDEVRKPNNG